MNFQLLLSLLRYQHSWIYMTGNTDFSFFSYSVVLFFIWTRLERQCPTTNFTDILVFCILAFLDFFSLVFTHLWCCSALALNVSQFPKLYSALDVFEVNFSTYSLGHYLLIQLRTILPSFKWQNCSMAINLPSFLFKCFLVYWIFFYTKASVQKSLATFEKSKNRSAITFYKYYFVSIKRFSVKAKIKAFAWDIIENKLNINVFGYCSEKRSIYFSKRDHSWT